MLGRFKNFFSPDSGGTGQTPEQASLEKTIVVIEEKLRSLRANPSNPECRKMRQLLTVLKERREKLH